MSLARPSELDISPELVEAVERFPTARVVAHCGQSFPISPFDLYATCPSCGARFKVRAFSAHPELEDLFDAFFQWLQTPDAARLAAQRQQVLQEE
jgi:hypothetical protein